MTYKQAVRKIKWELIGMAPFVWLGKIYGRLFPLKHPTSHFLIFPNADIGGGPKVDADIVACILDKKPLIIFSKKHKNNGFLPLFRQEGVQIMDLHRKIDNKLYHFVNFFYRGVIATWINRAEDPVVFGGECIFFYKVIPHLKKDIPRIELCHVDRWLGYTIGFIDRITLRICSTLKLKEAILRQYGENNISAALRSRVHFIDNKIDIPEYQEVHNPRLEVVFIGRGSPQKRVHLITAIAARMHSLGLPAHVSLVGDVENVINPADFPFCTFYGNVTSDELMHSIYRRSDVLLLTSAFEGLPLVVMQMMAYGKVVLSTAVNGIPDYISHMTNGLLIRATDEAGIVEEGVQLLQLLIDHPALRLRLGEKNMQIAAQKFDGQLFCRQYRKVLQHSPEYPE